MLRLAEGRVEGDSFFTGVKGQLLKFGDEHDVVIEPVSCFIEILPDPFFAGVVVVVSGQNDNAPVKLCEYFHNAPDIFLLNRVYFVEQVAGYDEKVAGLLFRLTDRIFQTIKTALNKLVLDIEVSVIFLSYMYISGNE